MSEASRYHIAGSYYEACNCEAVCPCRRHNGVSLGRSTYGNCDFILSWQIIKGHSLDIDLSGLAVCMAGSYHDDEDGSPWSVFIYIDENASDAQFLALSDIFQGKAEGNMAFIANISKVLGVRRAVIGLDHSSAHKTIMIGKTGKVAVDRIMDVDGTVSCGIPGHDHPGQESISSLSLADGPFQWDHKERCGFSTDFAYQG